jgi:hypothetical protein
MTLLSQPIHQRIIARNWANIGRKNIGTRVVPCTGIVPWALLVSAWQSTY